MKPQLRKNTTGLHDDRRGLVTLEWALLLAAVGLPLLAVLRECLDLVAALYRFLALMISMPFP